LTFGLAYSAGTVHCCRIAPRYLRSTIQSIFSGLYTGIGAGIGGFAGGMIYNAFNGQTMYWIATVVLLGGFAISNFTNLIYYLRKGAKRGFKRAKQAGHRVKNSFYRMKASGSGTSSEFGSGSGNGSRAPSELGGEENPRTPTAAATGGGVPMIPVLYEKSNASPIV
jgi:MFS family permease